MGNKRESIPLLPPFLEEQPIGVHELQNNVEEVSGNHIEYYSLVEEVWADMHYNDYCNLMMRNRPRGVWYPPNVDLLRKIRKMTVPCFDRSTKNTVRAWVQKLDTYFQLNPMTKSEAKKFSTLHLDGEAHEWWFHGLVTLCNSNISSYEDFTQRLIDRFDMKDPEIHFRELVQLKQTSSPEAYIKKYQRMEIMVTDISE
jgi:hypothetical protein